MASGVSINWGGLAEAVTLAAQGSKAAQQLMTEIGTAMVGQTVRRFAAGLDPEGAEWQPVQTARRDSRGRQRKGRAKPLLDTGRLRSSISFSASAFDVHVGSNAVYARLHQLGGQAGRGRKVTIPARPYLGLSAEDQEEIAALVQDHLERIFRGPFK